MTEDHGNRPQKSRQRIGEYLIEQGIITEDILKTALQEQSVSGELLGKILLSNGFINQKQKIQALRATNVDRLADESTLITRCPSSALIDTQTMVLIEDQNEVYLASRQRKSDVKKRLKPYYEGYTFRWSSVDTERLDEYLSRLENAKKGQERQIDRFLKEALLEGASDIHIEPRSHSYSIFFRIDGVKRHHYEGTLDEYRKMVSQIKGLSNVDEAERRVPLDGGFQIEHQGRYIDLRVATTPTISGEKVVIRLLDPNNSDVDINQVGITRLKEWLRGVHEPHGLCLICGPTGSGKTTTLTSTTKSLDRFGKAIYTIEDPVEYRVPYITQVNVNRIVGFDFARGLRAFLRLDPDIVIVGEIRDLETAENAIKLAETGHLVIGTLHTESIIGSLGRLRDIGISINDARHLIKSIMVQRLVRKICTHCKGDGCNVCEGFGLVGRTLVSEVNHFKDGDEVMKAFKGESWWPSLTEDAVHKMQEGVTSRDEVLGLGSEAERILDAIDAKEL